MAQWLKQSTAHTFQLGPFVDETNGKDAEPSLTIAYTDCYLSKAGAAMAAGALRGMTREQELDALKQQADQAASVLESIRQRITELESEASGT